MPAPSLVSAGSSAATAPAGAASAPGVARSGRLRNGELRRQVAVFLDGASGGGFTAGEIARALSGRSPGAVANALATLVSRGEAVLVTECPARYRATAATAGLAAAPPTSAPPTSAPPIAAPPTSAPPIAAAPTAATMPGRRIPAPSSALSSSASAELAVDPSVVHPVVHSVAPGATAAVEEVVTGPIARPNGQMYHPRLVAGVPDVTALRRLRGAGVPALLYGPPGTGKTSVVEAAFGDLITVPGDGDTTVADLVGEYTQTADGRYMFVHGPLVRAMREGRVLFVDDATLIPPSVLAVVYPAMDGRRQIVVKANGGEVVDAVAGFYVVAGHNPGVHGAILTDALSSRFSAQIQVSSDYDIARHLKVDRRAVRAARNLATRQGRGEIGWAPQLRELIAFDRIAGVLGVEAAAANLVGVAPEEDRATVASVVRDAFGAAYAPLALGHRI